MKPFTIVGLTVVIAAGIAAPRRRAKHNIRYPRSAGLAVLRLSGGSRGRRRRRRPRRRDRWGLVLRHLAVGPRASPSILRRRRRSPPHDHWHELRRHARPIGRPRRRSRSRRLRRSPHRLPDVFLRLRQQWESARLLGEDRRAAPLDFRLEQHGLVLGARGRRERRRRPRLHRRLPASYFFSLTQGSATVFSGKTGLGLFSTVGAANGAFLGLAVAGVGDVDGDGIPDWAAGAPQMFPNVFPAVPAPDRCASSRGQTDRSSSRSSGPRATTSSARRSPRRAMPIKMASLTF